MIFTRPVRRPGPVCRSFARRSFRVGRACPAFATDHGRGSSLSSALVPRGHGMRGGKRETRARTNHAETTTAPCTRKSPRRRVPQEWRRCCVETYAHGQTRARVAQYSRKHTDTAWRGRRGRTRNEYATKLVFIPVGRPRRACVRARVPAPAERTRTRGDEPLRADDHHRWGERRTTTTIIMDNVDDGRE